MNGKVLHFVTLALALISAPAGIASAPSLPIPSGPYGIGRTGYDWTDASRPDRFSADPKAHRELMVYLWYPTQPQAAAQPAERGPYIPDAGRMDANPEAQHEMRGEFESNWPLIVSGAIYSHAVTDAPAAKRPRTFPVIVFSHGNGGTGFEYTSLIEDLVSHGYVVAAIEHTYTAVAVAFPGGKIVPFHRDQDPPGLSPQERMQRMFASVSVGVEEGAADVRFVLNQLTALNGLDAKSNPLAGRLDLNKIAAMGHSAGAEFEARACQLDARIKACVDLDGGMVPIAALPEYPDNATIKSPLLFLEIDYPESRLGGTHEQHLEYFKRKAEQLKTSSPGSYDVLLKSEGIYHGSFSDYPLLAAGDDKAKIATALHNLQLTQSFILAFLDKNLKGQKSLILDGHDADHPEATIEPLGR